ncbi:MAG: BamA/TamA family outer membrane protein [Phormidium sp. BM_Day4_Bin.17]|nr:BamA/TamA family outer membrane protein [Phormidium sp. BM_Day4_Bin.17]UCJ11707.1 MAG: BamA/TamA family outer membrane protein [Phormidium sp. PBR-2020]
MPMQLHPSKSLYPWGMALGALLCSQPAIASTVSSASNLPNTSFQSQSGDVPQLAQRLRIEADSPTRFVPILGPIPRQRPEVYSPEILDRLESGFFLGGDFGIQNAEGIFAGLRAGYRDGEGRSIVFTGRGGEFLAGADLTYTQAAFSGDETGAGRRVGYRLSANFNNTRDDAFLSDGDDDDVREVFLPVGDEHEPWVNRLGFETQVMVPISSNTVIMPGLSYEKIRIQNRAFADNLFPVDEEGNRLSASNDGKDDLVLLSLFAMQDNVSRDEYGFPLSGNVFQFGTEQSIPIGTSSLDFNRLSAGYVQYLPVNLFGFAEGPRTLVFGLQGGTILGDVPGYEAFNLGGFNSARGYGQGDVGTASSFIQARLEYRFPIAVTPGGFFEEMRGSLGVQYVTDFDTASDVIGSPSVVRNEPGDGFGFSVGLHFLDLDVPIVDTLRITAGVNDRGDFRAYFAIGPAF